MYPAAKFVLLLICTTFTISALDNGVFLRPPMGWISWGRFRCIMDCDTYPDDCISDRLFMDMADRMAQDGWRDAGYEYINIDDCWQEPERDATTNKLVADRKRFPNGVKALADYIHSKGLKFGLYSDVGEKTCQKYPGSLDHYELDAQTFADWEIDSLKFDGCFADLNKSAINYPAMSAALNKTGRPIAYVCEWPFYVHEQVDLLQVRQYCNQWRNYYDMENSVESLNKVVDYFAHEQDRLVEAAGPGGWNDPDMLIGGNNCLTTGQTMIQMSLWAILAAPLMLGSDIRRISPEIKAVLQNKRVIRVNQDPLGKQGKRVKIIQPGSIEVWVRELENQEMAFAVVHRAYVEPFVPHQVSLSLKDIGWNDICAEAENLYETTAKKPIGIDFKVSLEYQSVAMYRLYRKDCSTLTLY